MMQPARPWCRSGLTAAVACFAMATLIGCGREPEVHAYREVAPPEASTAEFGTPPRAAMPDAAPPVAPPNPAVASGASIAWTTPAGWEQRPGGGMRVASFVLPGGVGDVSITALGGMAGGASANVRRWLGQLDLRLDDAAFAAFMKAAPDLRSEGGMMGSLYNFIPLRETWEQDAMLAGILVSGSQTVFVKATGPADALAREHDAFAALCRSLRFER